MKKMGIGLIGCGNISTAYLQLASQFSPLEMRAVADLDMAAAKTQAEKFNLRALSVPELLASGDIDIIVNLTVPAAHFEVTKQILQAGKHAFSEKPFVLSLQEGEALRKLADETGLRIGSAPDTFLGGAHQLARSLIDQGAIGEVLSGTCHVMSRGMEAWHPNPDFFFQPGGGPVLDLGPYYITNLVQLIGPVKAVSAMASTGLKTRTIGTGARTGESIPVDTPTTHHALLEFQSGAIITLGASWDVCAHRHENMELYGSEGSLYVPDPNFFGGNVLCADTSGGTAQPKQDDHPFGITNTTDGQGEKRANYRCAGLADMAAAILENRPHRCSLDLAAHVVDVMTSILDSGEKKRWVELSTSCTRPAALGKTEALKLLDQTAG
jgi:predicted dehydrogenase